MDDRRILVTVRTTEENLPVVRAVVDLACRGVVESAADDGRVELTGRAGSIVAAAGLLAGLGARAEVTGPDEVRRALARTAAENLSTYGTNG